MPRFVSNGGRWEPAQERAVNPKAPPGKEVYEGPDRAALEMIKQNGGQMGQDFHFDAELIMRAKQLGFKDVDEYLMMFNFDKKKADNHYKEAMKKVNTHQPEPVKPDTTEIGGGLDTSGSGQHRKGGFGDHMESLQKPAGK